MKEIGFLWLGDNLVTSQVQFYSVSDIIGPDIEFWDLTKQVKVEAGVCVSMIGSKVILVICVVQLDAGCIHFTLMHKHFCYEYCFD